MTAETVVCPLGHETTLGECDSAGLHYYCPECMGMIPTEEVKKHRSLQSESPEDSSLEVQGRCLTCSARFPFPVGVEWGPGVQPVPGDEFESICRDCNEKSNFRVTVVYDPTEYDLTDAFGKGHAGLIPIDADGNYRDVDTGSDRS